MCSCEYSYYLYILFLFHVCDNNFLKVSSSYIIFFHVVVYLLVDLASFPIRSVRQMLVILTICSYAGVGCYKPDRKQGVSNSELHSGVIVIWLGHFIGESLMLVSGSFLLGWLDSPGMSLLIRRAKYNGVHFKMCQL